MDLKPIQLEDFVREALSQIVKGVHDAQKSSLPNNAEVNPVFYYFFPPHAGNLLGINEKRSPIFNVQFEVSVTAGISTKTDGKAGINIQVLSLGTQGATEKQNSAVSKITFQVPVTLPGKLYQDVMPEATYGAEEIRKQWTKTPTD
jgi:hypothetical protein